MKPKRLKKIVFAPTTEVEYLSIWMEEICDAMRDLCECGAPLFVSDMSYIGELTEDEELKKLSERLGVPIDPKDLFIDVAKKLKKARE